MIGVILNFFIYLYLFIGVNFTMLLESLRTSSNSSILSAFYFSNLFLNISGLSLDLIIYGLPWASKTNYVVNIPTFALLFQSLNLSLLMIKHKAYTPCLTMKNMLTMMLSIVNTIKNQPTLKWLIGSGTNWVKINNWLETKSMQISLNISS